MRKVGMFAWMAGTALLLGAPALQAIPAVGDDRSAIVTAAATTTVSDWTRQVWAAALAGNREELDRLLTQCPAPTERFTDARDQYQNHLLERETKRAERVSKVSARLDEQLTRIDSPIGLSVALQAAIELSMLAREEDKGSVLTDERVKRLIKAAEKAADKATQTGDWLTASDLYYRLEQLFDERGRYKQQIRRETQRLAMIRLYAPERLWELRNDRRNAEIEWRKANPKTETAEDEQAKAAGRKVDEFKPLPPYNPMGDNYKEKLTGIDENLVFSAINRGVDRHVERIEVEQMIRGGLDAVRTLITTDDFKRVFAGISDAGARDSLLATLDAEANRLKTRTPSKRDLPDIMKRLVEENERTTRLPKEALLHEFGNGCMAALDEFSGIIWPDEIRRFNKNTQGKFVGVGIQIEMDPLWNIRVVTPLDGTPAQRAGIRAGDIIKKVNGQPTEGFTIDQAVDVITGPIATKVVLTVERDVTNDAGEAEKSEIDYTLTRAEIQEATVKGWRRSGAAEDAWDWYISPESKIGYIRLTKFAENTDIEFDRAIDQLTTTGFNGLILDLRYNPGGLLEQAVAITSRFVDGAKVRNFGGVVVTTHTQNNELVQTERAQSRRARLAGVPVVVLVNEGSASASEIVSGALQDYAKAGDAKVVVVGGRSYGKGSVQNVWGLNAQGTAAVKVTTQYYHLPGGGKIHRLPDASQWGVDPNLKVEMLPQQIAEAIILRQNADIAHIGERQAVAGGEARPPANPEELLTKGTDLQLAEALLILEAQAVATTDKPLVQKSSKDK